MRDHLSRTGIVSPGLMIILLFLIQFPVSADEDLPRVQYSIDFDQILSIRFGVYYPVVVRQGGVRFSLGVSPLGFPLISYSAAGVYHFRCSRRAFQLDAEAGLLLAYFNYFEGVCIDWDPIIDDPFHGWVAGAALVWGYRSNSRQYSLITGAGPWWEWQRDSGWKGPTVMPVVGLRYGWAM